MLIILMAGTFEQLLKPGEKDYRLEIFLALTGIAVCTANFILGKSIGSRFHRRIAGGQALAQKNIILPMWLTFQYLDPIASVSLAAYSIFQNIVNAAQIWLKGRRDDRIIQRLHDFHEKSTPAYRPPSSLSLRKNTPNSSRSCLPASRTGSRNNRATHAQTERASEHTGKSRAPSVQAFITECLPTTQQAPAKPAAPNGKALQKSSPVTTPCTGSVLLFSARHAAPSKPPRRSALHLPSPNPKQNARRTQATGVVLPPKEGTFPLRPLPKGNV